jgi:hypothetical protein
MLWADSQFVKVVPGTVFRKHLQAAAAERGETGVAAHVVVAALARHDALAARATSELMLVPSSRIDELREEAGFVCSVLGSIKLLIPSPNFFIIE